MKKKAIKNKAENADVANADEAVIESNMVHTVAQDEPIVSKKVKCEKNFRKKWQKFLGEDFELKFGQFLTRAKDNATVKVYDENLQVDNGLMFLEYEMISTGDKFTAYENEWVISKGVKRIHATEYMKRNLSTLYNNDLDLIPQYDD